MQITSDKDVSGRLGAGEAKLQRNFGRAHCNLLEILIRTTPCKRDLAARSQPPARACRRLLQPTCASFLILHVPTAAACMFRCALCIGSPVAHGHSSATAPPPVQSNLSEAILRLDWDRLQGGWWTSCAPSYSYPPRAIDCLLIPHTAGIRKLLRSPRSIAGRLPLTRRSVVALLGAVVCSLRTPQTAAHPCRTPQTRCPRPCFAPPRARRSTRRTNCN
jgi:hypothetical protein